MTAEQRWILDLVEVLTLRLECNSCHAAIVYNPGDWREAPIACPACSGLWDVPQIPGEAPSPLQSFGLGLRGLLQREKAMGKAGAVSPYFVKFEIRDPQSTKWGS